MAKNSTKGIPKDQPTPRQKALALILATNPDISAAEAIGLAGYSISTQRHPKRALETKNIKSIREAYLYEVSRRITPATVAKRIKEGLKSKDLNTSLKYIQEYKKDFNIATDTASTAIQINLAPELRELAE